MFFFNFLTLYSVLIKESKKFIKSKKKKSHIRGNIALLGVFCDFDGPLTGLEFF